MTGESNVHNGSTDAGGATATAMHEVVRGADALRALLDRRTHDLRTLDFAGFRRWLNLHLERWRGDPAFVQRLHIRALRRAEPRLARLEAELQHAESTDAASPEGLELQRLEKELRDSAKAIRGLADALARATPPRNGELLRKLDHFRERRTMLLAERRRLRKRSETRGRMLRLRGELQRLRADIGLVEAEAALEAIVRPSVGRTGRAGAGFEERAAAAVRQHLVPELAADAGGTSAAGSLVLLRGVSLGAAHTELDAVLVRRTAVEEPVEVLGVVEAKRNPNDLGHGFRVRRQNLAWFAGATAGYDPAAYRTRRFASGHFDRAAVHRQDGERYRFAPGSFRHFRDSAGGIRLDRLCFVTRPATLWGVSSAGLARLAHRAATDPRWDLEDPDCLVRLQNWARAATHPIEAPDVLRAYLASPRAAGRILFLRS